MVEKVRFNFSDRRAREFPDGSALPFALSVTPCWVGWLVALSPACSSHNLAVPKFYEMMRWIHWKYILLSPMGNILKMFLPFFPPFKENVTWLVTNTQKIALEDEHSQVVYVQTPHEETMLTAVNNYSIIHNILAQSLDSQTSWQVLSDK